MLQEEVRIVFHDDDIYCDTMKCAAQRTVSDTLTIFNADIVDLPLASSTHGLHDVNERSGIDFEGALTEPTGFWPMGTVYMT